MHILRADNVRYITTRCLEDSYITLQNGQQQKVTSNKSVQYVQVCTSLDDLRKCISKKKNFF